MKNKFSLYVLTLLVLSLLSSCEEEFVPDTIDAEQPYIVEAYVNHSERSIPPYVILTQSIPFFSEINKETFNNIFVKNAAVSIYDGEKSVVLTHICLQDLPPEIKPFVSSSLGLDSISPDFNFCIYIDIMNQVDVHENGIYDLDIKVEGKNMTARTTIPPFVGLDSIWMAELSGEPIDTLRQLYCKIKDPASIANFYQYKNGYVGGPLNAPFVSSLGDFLFDGKDFKFPMDRAVKDFSKEDRETFRYFRTGDSVRVEWICIDKEQYEFWNTLELDRIQQGPFSSYVKAKSNINGGLGVFSGRSSKEYRVAN